MVDPHVPKNPAPERIILACGPDLGHLRTTASAEVAKESSYHGRRTLVLFADQSVQYLTMDAMGRITNTRFANTAYADPDIYTDDDYDGDGDYLNDDKWDANLGNWWVDYEAETPIARYHKGPRWDRRE